MENSSALSPLLHASDVDLVHVDGSCAPHAADVVTSPSQYVNNSMPLVAPDACDTFSLDMSSKLFNTCTCGHPRDGHAHSITKSDASYNSPGPSTPESKPIGRVSTLRSRFGSATSGSSPHMEGVRSGRIARIGSMDEKMVVAVDTRSGSGDAGDTDGDMSPGGDGVDKENETRRAQPPSAAEGESSASKHPATQQQQQFNTDGSPVKFRGSWMPAIRDPTPQAYLPNSLGLSTKTKSRSVDLHDHESIESESEKVSYDHLSVDVKKLSLGFSGETDKQGFGSIRTDGEARALPDMQADSGAKLTTEVSVRVSTDSILVKTPRVDVVVPAPNDNVLDTYQSNPTSPNVNSPAENVVAPNEEHGAEVIFVDINNEHVANEMQMESDIVSAAMNEKQRCKKQVHCSEMNEKRNEKLAYSVDANEENNNEVESVEENSNEVNSFEENINELDNVEKSNSEVNSVKNSSIHIETVNSVEANKMANKDEIKQAPNQMEMNCKPSDDVEHPKQLDFDDAALSADNLLLPSTRNVRVQSTPNRSPAQVTPKSKSKDNITRATSNQTMFTPPKPGTAGAANPDRRELTSGSSRRSRRPVGLNAEDIELNRPGYMRATASSYNKRLATRKYNENIDARPHVPKLGLRWQA